MGGKQIVVIVVILQHVELLVLLVLLVSTCTVGQISEMLGFQEVIFASVKLLCVP